MNKILSTVLGIMLFVAIGSAQTGSWKLDKAHSQVTFSVTHMVISEVTGVFKEFDITFSSDKEDLTDTKVEAIIKTKSIDTGNERRDNHVRSDEFLNAEKFPEMKFKSNKVEKTGQDTYKITGDMTIRDVTKSVVLDTKYKGSIKDAMGNTRIAFKATTTIDRFEFGTTWNKAIETGGLVAGKDIEVTLLMEFTKPK